MFVQFNNYLLKHCLFLLAQAKFDVSIAQQLLLFFIVAYNHPFSIVEQQGFIDLLLYLNGAMVMVTAQTIRNRVISNYLKGKRFVITELLKPGNGRISSTTDLWTSGNNHAIIGVTIVWLDENFEMRELVIGFRKVSGEHSGVNLAKYFLAILTEWKIVDKVCRHDKC